MLSRALSLATVILLTGFATVPVQAQNLEAGKSPSQVFAGGCAVCHKSPRGLLKTVAPGSLPGFLRQHYTTSTDMAAAMSAYVISNGAADRRLPGDNLTKQGRELTTEQKPNAAPAEAAPTGRRPRQDAARPDADGLPEAEQGTRRGRNAKRQARPAVENPEAGKPADGAPAAAEAPPTGQKQKLGKKGRRHQEEPVKDEPKAAEPKTEPKPDTAKSEPAKPDVPKEEVSKPDMAKPAEPKPETPALRADPVPAVTPAPAETAPAPVAPSPAPAAPPPAAEPAPAAPPAAAAPSPAPEPAAPKPSVPPPVPPSASPPPAPTTPAAPAGAPVSQ